MLKIYHNTRCKISRQGLAILQEKGIPFEIIDYLKNPPSLNEMKRLLMKLNIDAQGIIRANEELFKKNFKGKNFTEEEWIKILIENPVLIERPIVEMEHKAMIGRPVEKISELLNKQK